MFVTSDLFGRFHSPRRRNPLQQQRDHAAASSLCGLSALFENLFPAHLLSQADEGPNSRERTYSLRVTFWAFVWQVLNPNQACRQTVRMIQAWFAALGASKISEDTSPYCQGRKRLPKQILEKILEATWLAADQRAQQNWRFHDREVVVGDGTTVQAPDTPENQRAFPQSAKQAEGCGFPLVKIVGLFSLTSGALMNLALGNKHGSELGLFRRIWETIKKGSIFLADRGFCDFVTLLGLWMRGVDSVLRLNSSRGNDFRKGKKLGKYDRLVVWRKPSRRTRTASKTLWSKLPQEATLRLIQFPVCIPGFRPRKIALVTTLLDSKEYPASELAALYVRRWQVELFLRNIKTTLKMEVLSCMTPAMVRKEVLMHFIAYNLIRCVMTEAAGAADIDVQRISFKGTLDTILEFSKLLYTIKTRSRQRKFIIEMLRAIARDELPDRPNRVEPRNQKRRPKAFPHMCHPRKKLRAKLLKNRRPRK